MVAKKNNLYLLLVLAICLVLLLPYLGIFDFSAPEQGSINTAPRTVRKEVSATDQKKRLAEIEDLLD